MPVRSPTVFLVRKGTLATTAATRSRSRAFAACSAFSAAARRSPSATGPVSAPDAGPVPADGTRARLDHRDGPTASRPVRRRPHDARQVSAGTFSA